MAPNKKLVIACDGTWDDSDYGMKKEYSLEHPWGIEMATPPSNVTRICRSILPHDEKDKQQIVYYQAGIGSEQNLKDKLWGGLTGFGLAQHVREAYAFLCHNYEDGDDIILIGFSRGAFTARTIGAMVDNLGLLSMRGMAYFFPIFKDWENKEKPGYVSPFQDPFSEGTKKPSLSSKFKDEPYQKFLEKQGLLKQRKVPIKCIGVFDTVGALGIPTLGIFRNHPSSEYTFVDTFVPESVQHAFQALALDEHRRPFTPTIWETPQVRKDLDLRQCWFPGVHANIGGGYPDTMSADITLAWMVSQMMKANILAFDLGYIRWLWQQNIDRSQTEPRDWSLGRIDESLTGVYDATGSLIRSPMNYYEHNSETGEETKIRCKGTNERVHASVRIRKGKHGLGLDDKKGPYDPPALKGWTCTGVNGTKDKSSVRWVPQNQELQEMQEDDLLDFELELLNMTPLRKENIWSIQGSPQAQGHS